MPPKWGADWRSYTNVIMANKVLLEKSFIDTKDVSTQYCAIPGGKGGGFKWPSLTELHVKLFSVGFSSAHNASADVDATARCFLELVRLKVIPFESNSDITEKYINEGLANNIC